MKQEYKKVRFQKQSTLYLKLINTIIDQYQQVGLKLTLRQLYYQLVSHGAIDNKLSEYSKLSRLLTRARMGGYIDWDAIEDRVRRPIMHSEWKNITSLVESACNSFRLKRWIDQSHYVELWTEKDAIANILYPITDKFHITLMVNRGYSSVTAMYDSANRYIKGEGWDAKKCILLYLGDHDPSGLDMDRDIQKRLSEFDANIIYKRIGLTWEQIQEHEPPPNPTKIKDPRAESYIEEYGTECWEVDALPPDVLNRVVEDAISDYVDVERMEHWKGIEDKLKVRLKESWDYYKEENNFDEDEFIGLNK